MINDKNDSIRKLLKELSNGTEIDSYQYPKSLNQDLIIDYLNLIEQFDLNICMHTIAQSDYVDHFAISNVLGHPEFRYPELKGCDDDYLFSNDVSLCGLPFNYYSYPKPGCQIWTDIERIMPFQSLIINHFKNENKSFNQPFLFAEFPLLELNAEARKTNNGFLFLMNRGLVSFMHIYSFLFTASFQHCLGPMSEEKGLNSLNSIFKLLIDFGIFQSFPENEILLANSDFASIPGVYILRAKRMFSTIIEFILLHELSHGILGHLDSKQTTSAMSRNFSKDIKVVSKNLEEEDAADKLAGKLVVLNGEDIHTVREKLITLDRSFMIGPEVELHFEGNHPLSRIIAISSYFVAMAILDDIYDIHACPDRWEQKLQINRGELDRGDDCSFGTTHRMPQERLFNFWYKLQELLDMPIKGENGILLFGFIEWNNYIIKSWHSNMSHIIEYIKHKDI